MKHPLVFDYRGCLSRSLLLHSRTRGQKSVNRHIFLGEGPEHSALSSQFSAPSLLSVLKYNEDEKARQIAWRLGHPGSDSTNIVHTCI